MTEIKDVDFAMFCERLAEKVDAYVPMKREVRDYLAEDENGNRYRISRRSDAVVMAELGYMLRELSQEYGE